MSSRSHSFTWMIAVLTCVSGLLVTGLGDSAPDAMAQADKKAEAPTSEKASDKAADQEEVKPVSKSKPPFKVKGPVIADESAISDIQRVRLELNEKQKELEKKEAELAARESALQDEIAKIDALRSDISKSSGSAAQQASEKITKLVETFESMSPKSAAQLINNLDETLATAALYQLSSVKLGKILSDMDPKNSAKLTESLAGVARAKKNTTTSRDVAEAATPKGGQTNDGNIKNDQSISSRQPEPALGREPAGSKP